MKKLKYVKTFENYGNSDYHYAYNCTNVNKQQLEELEAIIDDLNKSETVNQKDFIKTIPFEEIKECIPLYNNEKQFINDWSVRCYIGSFYYDNDEDFNREMCKDDNEEYYIEDYGVLIEYAVVVNSAIEYVWKKGV